MDEDDEELRRVLDRLRAAIRGAIREVLVSKGYVPRPSKSVASVVRFFEAAAKLAERNAERCSSRRRHIYLNQAKLFHERARLAARLNE